MNDGFWTRLRHRVFRKARPVAHETTTSAPDQPIFKSLDADGELSSSDKQATPGEVEPDMDVGFGSAVWLLGRRDASVGQPEQPAKKALDAHAELEWMERHSQAQRAINHKEAKLLLAKSQQSTLRKTVERLRLRRWQLSAYPLLPPDRSLSIMPPIYIIVGILAFVAEFPLSAQLVVIAFGMNNPALGQSGVNTAWALAAVLCVLGLAAKMFADSRAQLHAILPATGDAEVESEVKQAARSKRLAALILSGVQLLLIVMCFGTLCSVARLRTLVEATSRITGAQGAGNPQSPALTAALASQQYWADVTMFLLTVTLPFFGAVSWISAAAALRYGREDKHAYKALVSAEKELAKADSEITSLTHEISSARQQLADEKANPATRAALLALRKDVYQHGYARGSRIPEDPVETKLFELHVNALRRLANRQTRSHYVDEFRPPDEVKVT